MMSRWRIENLIGSAFLCAVFFAIVGLVDLVKWLCSLF